MHLRDELKISKALAPGHEVALAVLLTREYLSRFFEKGLFEEAGISDQQYNLLRILRGGPSEGYLIRDLRERMIYRFADVPRLVNRLEAQGLVKRCDNPSDRRGTRIRITEAGLALEAKVHEAHDKVCARLARCLPPEQREQLVNLLEALRDELREDLAQLETPKERRTAAS